jgi:hypothetical protein
VVYEQELDHGVLCVLDAIGLRVHHHPVLDRGCARDLKLRHPLDLDHAHPAGADRRPELALVAEVGHVDVAALGRLE